MEISRKKKKGGKKKQKKKTNEGGSNNNNNNNNNNNIEEEIPQRCFETIRIFKKMINDEDIAFHKIFSHC